jgi:hypothetical protein
MPLFSFSDLQATLNTKAQYSRKAYQFSHETLYESQESLYPDDYEFDVFLSHSYKDINKTSLLAMQARLERRFGLSVYIDWIIDRQLDRSQVTKRTARRLRMRMSHCTCLFFATSENSETSKWMPWELGYMDGYSGRVAILPIVHPTNKYTYIGQEYLGMYPYVDAEYQDGTEVKYIWINNDTRTYVRLDEWMKGRNPYKH